MSKKQTYTELDVVRSKCLNDFSFFVRYFFKKMNNKRFNVAEHHRELFHHAKRIVEGDVTKIMFNVAPRYGKTEVMVKMFIAYSLARNPSSRYIHLSYSDALALDNSSAVKELITSAEYQELFPYVQISKDSRAKERWYTTAGGGVLARSSSGQVTGFGAGQTNFDNEVQEFGGAIIIDDPIKPDDANSETLRERVNNKFNTTIRNRVNSESTPIIIIMQRLHPEDLCGYLLENEPEDWEVVRMPVIKEDGTALWTEKHDLQTLEKMREQLGIIFETQYMQNPEPSEGFLIPIKEIRLLPKERGESHIKRFVHIDPSEKNGDMMCAIFIQSETIEDKLNFHVYDVVHSNKGFEYVAEKVHELAVETSVDEIIFEKNGVGLATGMKLKTLNIDKSYKLVPYHETQNKEAKILSNYEFVKKRFSFESDYETRPMYKEFIKHLTQYSAVNSQPHKRDAIDSACSFASKAKLLYRSMLKLD